MASSKEIIELLFNSKYNDAGTRALKRDLGNLGDSVGKGVSVVANFTAALATMEGAAIAASIGLAKVSAEAAGKFQTGFNEINTLLNLTGDDLTAFKNDVKSYAAESTLSIEAINGSLYNAISAGVEYKDSIEFLTAAEKLNVAGKGEMEQTIKVLASSLTAYGEETDQAAKYSDILFKTVKNGVTTLPELSGAMAKVTAIASPLGVSFEEVNAAIAQLTAGGFSTTEAVTYLGELLTGLSKPSGIAATESEKLGLTFDATTLQARGLSGVLGDVTKATNGNYDATKLLFGSNTALKAAMVLTSDVGLKGFNEKLDEATNALGSTDEAFKIMEQNIENVKQKLSTGIDLTLISIGEPLLDDFKDIDLAIKDIFAGIRKNVEDPNGALVPVVDAIEGVAEQVAGVIRSISVNMNEALNLADMSGYTGAFDQLGDAMGGLNLTDPEGLARAIGAVGDAFESLTSFTLGAGDVIKGMLGAFSDLASHFDGMADGDIAETAGAIGGYAIALGLMSAALGPLLVLLKALQMAGGVVGALGTAQGMAAAGTSLKALALGVGKLGAAGVALYGGFKAGGWIADATNDAFGWADAMVDGVEPTEQMQAALDDYAKSIGKTSVTTKEYIEGMKEKAAVSDQAAKAAGDVAFATEQAAGAEELWGVSITKTYTAEEKARAARAVAKYSIDENTGLVTENTKALEKNAVESNATADGVSKVAKAAKEAAAKLSAIKSPDKIFDFHIARVESEAKQIASIMDSLGASAKASGDGISGAFSAMGSGMDTGAFDGLGFADKWKLDEQIDRQISVAETTADAQAKIANAKALYMNQQSQSMANGNSLIQITDSGLEPEIEAFMFKILEKIQVKVAADQADFLIGMP